MSIFSLIFKGSKTYNICGYFIANDKCIGLYTTYKVLLTKPHISNTRERNTSHRSAARGLNKQLPISQ